MSLFRCVRLVVFILCLMIRGMSWAGLDEVVIYTSDGQCGIRYLTTHTKNHWTIETDNQNCVDGFVHGFSLVKVFDPTHHLTETIDGFFLNGYWLDHGTLVGNLQDRSNPQDNVQALTFHLGEDDSSHLSYLVQARSTRLENRPYGPFTVCPTVRILVVASDQSVFKNPEIQDKIAKQSMSYALALCPDVDEVAVFGTQKMNARAPDIEFQMQIDPQSMAVTLMPISYDYQNSDITVPVELRHEGGTVISSVVGENIPDSKIVTKPIEMALPLSAIADLHILSQLSVHGITGRVIVHIQSVDLDGTGHVDLPEPIQLKYYPNLKSGWAVIEGKFYNHTMDVSKVEYCQQEWCSDVA